MLRRWPDRVDPKNITAWLQFNWMPQPFQDFASLSPNRPPSQGVFIEAINDNERETARPVMHLPGQPEHWEIAVRSPQSGFDEAKVFCSNAFQKHELVHSL